MNAVIYARYSSHGQTEQSIEGQLHDNYAWAKQQGIQVVGEYIDRALTGTRDQRPDFQRMVADAAKRQFEMVIVWKLDRFARNRYDSAVYKARLKKFGVRVVSVKENITDTPEGIILEGLLESMAEYYSANLSQNVRRGLRESLAKGHFCGGKVPYGYKVQDHKLVPDERLAPVVRYIFEQYASGVSKKAIIDDLNRQGVRNMQGNPLSFTNFSHILPNSVYIGLYTYSGQVVPGVAEPIIDEKLFQDVQARLRRTARAPAAGRSRVDFLLTGKLFCGLCGGPVAGESGRSRHGDVYYYYACRARKKRRACPKKNERKEFLEWYVVQQTMQHVTSPASIARIARAVAREYEKEFSDSRVDEFEKTLARLERDLETLVDILTDAPKAARPKIYARMEALEAQRAEVETNLASLRIASKLRLTEADIRAMLKVFSTGDPMDPDFRRRMIDTFVSAVYLFDDRIVVFYNLRSAQDITHADLLTALSHPTAGSSLRAITPPIAFKSEPELLFVNGNFGCLFWRNLDAEE